MATISLLRAPGQSAGVDMTAVAGLLTMVTTDNRANTGFDLEIGGARVGRVTGLGFTFDGAGTVDTGSISRLVLFHDAPAGAPALRVDAIDIGARALFLALGFADEADAVALLTSAADTITGSGGNDRIFGGAQGDVLFGLAGGDVMFGGTGDDRLVGGAGADRLSGGSGADDFVFTAAQRGAPDRITDLVRNVDDILLYNAGFPRLGAAGALGSRYVEGTRALGPEDRVIYRPSTGEVFFDPDGTGAQARLLVVQVTPGLDLSAADFLVVRRAGRECIGVGPCKDVATFRGACRCVRSLPLSRWPCWPAAARTICPTRRSRWGTSGSG